jgi:iron complex outermembrane receptor protein
MRNDRSRGRLETISGLMALMVASGALAQEESLEQVVVTGTRVANRSALDTAVPVDVVTSETLNNIGISEVNQALSVALPSFNFPRPGLADGTDTIRPATLRGLSPDQTLVLVNGKRRHASSLVNVNGTIGRGAAAVDLNTIPSAILKSVEVLRDGASAQYGSDAIAGVINLRLRDDKDGGEASATYGWRESSYETITGTPPAGAGWSAPPRLKRDVSDGETLTVSAWKGLPLGDSGFAAIAAEYKDQEHTERGGWDHRQQYPLVAPATYDPRELAFDRYDSWYGEPELEEKTLFVNSGYDFESGAKLYGWASWQRRDARSAGFFRRALDDRNTLQIYPNGFLPIIAPQVNDYSAAAGVTWKLGEWDMDSSLVYGKNKMEFTIENTLNRSLGPSSKTTFDAGGFDYDQAVLNLAGVRAIEIGAFASPLNVAAGVEARREGYSIFAGEPDSYRNGGALLPPTAQQPGGAATQSGSQVFPGFRPADAVDEHRSAVGAYIDLEANVTEKFLASAAVRAEHYSDFGDNVSGKLAGRFNFTESFALRGSVQNGFRAPSLQQQFFSATSTNFNTFGVPFDVATFPVTNPAAVALGAKPLDAEESINYSVGAVLQFGELSMTIDAYRIDIDDRIVLSENLTQATVQAYLTTLGFIGVGGGRFFLNGVDTETQGVDIVMNYPFDAGGAGRFDLTLTGNFNSTDVTRVPQIATLSSVDPSLVLFDRLNVKVFEEGSPRNKFTAGVNWTIDRFGATLRAIRYGESLTPANSAASDFVNEATTLVDVEARFDVTGSIRLAVGADNVFDEYPESLPIGLNTTANAPFSNYSPYGRSGRFVYGRVGVSF